MWSYATSPPAFAPFSEQYLQPLLLGPPYADAWLQPLLRLLRSRLRGAAPFLAVITEATLRTHPRQPLLVRRSLAAVETLAEHLQQAEGLSRQWSSSFVLGVPPDVVDEVNTVSGVNAPVTTWCFLKSSTGKNGMFFSAFTAFGVRLIKSQN